MNEDKLILDACCGSRMFWFDRKNPNVLFQDVRDKEYTLCDGRKLEVHPDVIGDFTKMEYPDNTFQMVVFDPPHLDNANETSYMAQKYGTLRRVIWKDDIKKGFDECMRVLKDKGTLIFKWNETRIPVKRIIEVIGKEPLFGHRTAHKTIWLCFMKGI